MHGQFSLGRARCCPPMVTQMWPQVDICESAPFRSKSLLLLLQERMNNARFLLFWCVCKVLEIQCAHGGGGELPNQFVCTRARAAFRLLIWPIEPHTSSQRMKKALGHLSQRKCVLLHERSTPPPRSSWRTYAHCPALFHARISLS